MKKHLRAALVEMQRGICPLCSLPFQDRGSLVATLDHIKRKKDGGTDEVTNLRAVCAYCNQHREGKQKATR